jgi:RNA polymerase sigma-70 factor (ECF subfamily)
MQAVTHPSHQTCRISRKSDGDKHLPQDRLQSLSDEELVEKCRQSDPTAFDVLIRRYERSIYRMALRLTGNYDDAHDIAAEAFLRIYRAFDTFQAAITLPAWVKRIVTNVYHDRRRYVRRRPAVSLDVLIEKTGDALGVEESTSPASPYAQVEANECKNILNQAIKALPEYQRRIIMLFHREDCSYEEIADEMGIPVGTVKSRLNRARVALRQMLAPHRSALVS